MSMTQVAFLRKADIPTKAKIEEILQGLGYDFKILEDFENIAELDGLSCSINGNETFFEIYFNQPTEIAKDFSWITLDLTNLDTAISFVSGADFAAGACIGLVSIALIDKSQALIYYLDDKMKYSREMLVADTLLFLKELDKHKLVKETGPTVQKSKMNKPRQKKRFWDRLNNLFK